MSRGNQRDKAREANMKKQAAQKKAHGMSGSELAKAKELAAQKMREKQAAGMRPSLSPESSGPVIRRPSSRAPGSWSPIPDTTTTSHTNSAFS
ncbi:uncharacterized protein B0T15DRAFT_536828 [Chaetomium strumarium]|uniref:Small EDRK-rich factor-like N-terminal domain-containing protein n=1 Tax=Chaetomium strumarium TaxID=1170767 RepID=A0AAJ0GQZ3_9PEZI|nr:hypothetical protein B0T15DRAFT_536828 [Chaetomium strumarium]